jgi:gas vesicle protein
MLTKASLGAAKSIPGSGAVLDLVEADAVANKLGEYTAFIARKLTNKDEVQLLNEPLEVLTPLFLEDLNRIAEKQTVVLLLDTYEQTGSFLDDWLRSLLDGRYGDITPNFLLGIAGRDPLSRNIWADMESWIARSELEPFTQDETRQYLTNSGITSEAVIQEIWRLSSGGLPLLIGMMAQATPTSINVIVDPCEEAVERFLKWELDGTKRQLALNAALPRMLNRDILALLVDKSAVNDLFEWLKERSFVVEHPEGWQYHNIVREQMLRYQRRISPKGWKEQHTQLAEYYEGLRKGLGLTDTQQLKNETWQKYTLEWLYHSLCANPLQQMGMVLNGWLTALDTSNKFAQEWAEVMKMAAIATSSEDMKRWSQRFQDGLQSLEQKRWDEMVEILAVLLQENLLEDKCRAIALLYQGFYSLIYFISKNNNSQSQCETNKLLHLDQINEVLNQALKLDPVKKECFIVRCFVHIFRKDINDAKTDFNLFVDMDELDKDFKNNIESLLSEMEELQKQKEEEKRLTEEQQRLTEELQRLKEKAARKKKLAQKLR